VPGFLLGERADRPAHRSIEAGVRLGLPVVGAGFGSLGLWLWNDAVWTQISLNHPEQYAMLQDATFALTLCSVGDDNSARQEGRMRPIHPRKVVIYLALFLLPAAILNPGQGAQAASPVRPLSGSLPPKRY